MKRYSYIEKKPYVAPSVTFEEIEALEDVLAFRPSANTTGGGSDVGQDDTEWGNSAKQGMEDFVFEIDDAGEE